MAKSLKRGMTVVMAANLINMVFSLLNTILLPRFLPVPAYAALKTYMLYAGYVGVLHLGFLDGIYLKYGGKDLDTLDRDNLALHVSTARLFQLAVTLSVVTVGFVIHDPIVVAFGLTVLPVNMADFFKFLYQACGEFSVYGAALCGSGASVFILQMLLLFGLKRGDGMAYVGVMIVAYVVVWVILEIYIRRRLKLARSYTRFSFTAMRESIGSGLPLMLGNLSSIVLTGMDRWFIKGLMDDTAFAMYAFAVSVEGLLNVAVQPVCITMYNYFCRETDREKVNQAHNMVMILGAFLVIAIFPARFVVEWLVPNYVDAIPVAILLFATQMLYVLIKGVYVNLYKAEKRQGRYFRRLLIVIVAAFALNAGMWLLMHTKEAFAVGTLAAVVFWLVLCVPDFKQLRFGFREGAYLIVMMTAYLLCAFCLPTIPGCAAYLAAFALVTVLLLRKDLQTAIGLIFSRAKR